MQDRIAKYPGRVKLTPVDEKNHLYHMERADEPLVEGTPIGKASLLSDETADILALNGNPTVDDALRVVAAGVVPTLLVSAQTGSTVTATKGSVVRKATEENGSWFFYLTTGTWTIQASLGDLKETQNITITEAKQHYLRLNYVRIYGVEWDGVSSSTWSRTDDAATFEDPVPYVGLGGTGSSPFDRCYPWSDMVTVTDETLASFSATISKQYFSFQPQMVAIPKFYYKWTRTGNRMKLQIAERKPEWRDDFLVSPAHADRGDGKGERDIVYVAKHKHVLNYSNGSRTQGRSIARQVGEDYWLFDFAMYWTIAMLYLVEFADWNCQKKIGYGCDYTYDNGADEGESLYHTGTDAKSRTQYNAYTKYRDIVGLWSDRQDWVDGIFFKGTEIYCQNNPAEYCDGINDEQVAQGTLIGSRPTTNGYPIAWSIPTVKGFEYAVFPSALGGSTSTYSCDSYTYASGGQVLRIGASTENGQAYGLFRMHTASTWQESLSSLSGMRLMKLP